MKKFTCNFSQSSMAGEKIIGFARPVFKDKPSSAPQEAPKSQEQMDEAPSLDHMKKEVERFENNIKGFLKNMEEFYNQGMPKEMQITISTTEKPADNPELMKKYKAAGMGENAIEAIDALVDGLNLMKSAIAEKEDSNRIILARMVS